MLWMMRPSDVGGERDVRLVPSTAMRMAASPHTLLLHARQQALQRAAHLMTGSSEVDGERNARLVRCSGRGSLGVMRSKALS